MCTAWCGACYRHLAPSCACCQPVTSLLIGCCCYARKPLASLGRHLACVTNNLSDWLVKSYLHWQIPVLKNCTLPGHDAVRKAPNVRFSELQVPDIAPERYPTNSTLLRFTVLPYAVLHSPAVFQCVAQCHLALSCCLSLYCTIASCTSCTMPAPALASRQAAHLYGTPLQAFAYPQCASELN